MERFSEEHLKEHFKSKEEKRKLWRDKGRNYRENNTEKLNKYSRQYVNEKRHPELKEKRRALTKYIIEHGYPPLQESKIEIKENIIFPAEDFNKGLNKILKDSPLEVEEKNIKDLIYDIFDNRDILTPKRILNLYKSNLWDSVIQTFMKERNYTKNGDEKYIRTN